MRAVFGLVLLLGIALAGGAVYLAKDYVGQYQAALERERADRQAAVPTIDVYVANRPLKYGERLGPEDIRLVAWPEASVPDGVFVGVHSLYDEIYETSEDLPDELARTVLRTMEANEAILSVKLTAPGEAAGITSQLERGMRAFAIRVDVSTGVSGFLRPGDRVDVYWTGQINNGDTLGQGDVTKLIEAGVKIIAIDQSAAVDREETMIAQTVTVSARPEQVAALAQAQSTGRLSLSLVGAEDDTVAAQIEVDQRRLLGIQEEQRKQVQVEEKQVCTIRTRRGSEVVDIPIPCTN
ncbi:MAG: Flp pilus assembly protein CpaB [Rhodobacteraceae bacterium]|nr:Flp pilus assembly protein CpaB [Paracoccaceae bacterium]